MVNKSAKKAASPVDKQGDTAASAAQDERAPVLEGTGTAAPSPAVVRQARAASESPHKFVGSPKNSRRPASPRWSALRQVRRPAILKNF